MKRWHGWLYAIIIALVLSFDGIVESQIQSAFPKLNKQDVISIAFSNCSDVIFSVTTYVKVDDARYFVYEVTDTIFAIVEFGPKLDQSVAIYILQPNKTVLKFVPTEYDKLRKPCETIKILKLTNEHNTF